MKQKCLSCGHEYDAGMASCPKCGDATSCMVGRGALGVLQAQISSKELNDRGVRLFQQGKFNEAEGQLRKAIEANPGHEMAYSNLARVLIERGQPREAVKILEKVLAMNPHRKEAQRYLVRAQGALARSSHGDQKKPWWKLWG
jgi:tetratricopeptide (TPR) repeat protein